jgi:hypothetical protein
MWEKWKMKKAMEKMEVEGEKVTEGKEKRG